MRVLEQSATFKFSYELYYYSLDGLLSFKLKDQQRDNIYKQSSPFCTYHHYDFIIGLCLHENICTTLWKCGAKP